jgi:NADPH-dependent ferric siderophore reductase
MNHVTRTPLRVRHRPTLRLLQVARVEQITPRMRRITLTGDELEGFTTAAADDHVKLFFPASGQERLVLPSLAAGGVPSPSGAVQPAVRDYTPRRFDPKTGESDIEFVLHADGPASDWAAQAAPGQWIGVGGPRGSLLIPDDYASYLLLGDETALPSIARRLEEMRPDQSVTALIEVADRSERYPLRTAANVAVGWLYRDGVAAATSTLLDQALASLPLPDGETHAWFAGEIETIRRLRRLLTEAKGLPRSQVKAAGYWRVGEAGTHAMLDD